MASPTDLRNLSNEIRKLRKKLRQIDNLNRLDRPLSEEEEEKIARTPSIRSLLREKLRDLAALESSGLEEDPAEETAEADEGALQECDDPGYDDDDDRVIPEASPAGEEMKRPISEVGDGRRAPGEVVPGSDTQPEEDSSSSSKPPGGGLRSEQEGVTPAKVPRQEAEPEKEEEAASSSRTKKAPASNQGKAKTTAKGKGKSKAPTAPGDDWARSKFTARDLEGHNDVVCSVSCAGSRLLTGSRDTMVKYWDLETGAELRSIGGHSGTVTAVILLSREESSHLAPQLDLSSNDSVGVTGSRDCYVKVWSLETGQCLHSVYTYNPVECLGFIAQEGLVVSGSDGGKVELWDIVSGSNVFSVLGHDDSVTCIQVRGTEVYTSCSDGILKLWRLRESALHPTFVSETVSSQSSARPQARRHVRSLAVPGDTLFYGDDGPNVKALEWKRGLVHKLKHHSGDFGSTDAMCASSDLLVCAGYDLDTGCGYLNFWRLPEERYLATLSDQDVSRVVAMDHALTQEGALRIVTGGQELRIWDRIPQRRYSPQDAIPTEFSPAFSVKALDSDADSDSEEGTDESDGDAAGQGRRRRRRWSDGGQGPTQSSWTSWCAVI